jgi:uncharacterized membrane protein (DUF2068 family)
MALIRIKGAVRTVAVFEACKGGLVLAGGFGLLSLLHKDVQREAERFIEHAHLNPASRYPRIFLDVARELTDTHLVLLALGAALYAAVRFVEAWGLWRERHWAEWFAALSGGIYLPLEVLELLRRATWQGALTFAINLLIVALMIYTVRRNRTASPPPPR